MTGLGPVVDKLPTYLPTTNTGMEHISSTLWLSGACLVIPHLKFRFNSD